MIRGNITQEVKSYLSKDMSIQKNLKKGIVNIKALAQHIIREQDLKTSTDTVMGVIRKISFDDEIFTKDSEKVKDILKFSNITTRNGIICIILRNQSDIQKYLSEVNNLIEFEKLPRLIKGVHNLKIITDKENIQKIKTIFPEFKNFEIKENLSEIRLKTSVKADDTKGVLAMISNELMLKDININEMIICIPEMMIYVDQKDLLTAYQSMLSLCQGTD
ncbi:MAG: hypothetical protein Q8O03_06160 [Nanoarchaeota archaeon]|nr:hypothetical protein [Nanoarchaeota archaeon]